jgi:hypothetical protein
VTDANAIALWNAVVADYAADGLIELTNIRDRGATTINTAAGQSAAQATVNLWPVYAQSAFDSTNSQHMAIGEMGVIAVLWRRGGSAATIEQVRWDEVFGADGAVAKLKMTAARAHAVPSSSSGVVTSREVDASGRAIRPWSDPAALPTALLPSNTPVDDG